LGTATIQGHTRERTLKRALNDACPGLATGEQHLEWRHAPAAAGGVAMKGKTKTKKRKFAPNFASLFPLILFRDKSELGPRTKQQRAGYKRRPGSTGLRSQRQQQHPKIKAKRNAKGQSTDSEIPGIRYNLLYVFE